MNSKLLAIILMTRFIKIQLNLIISKTFFKIKHSVVINKQSN